MPEPVKVSSAGKKDLHFSPHNNVSGFNVLPCIRTNSISSEPNTAMDDYKLLITAREI